MAKIWPRRTQEAKMQRAAALLSAPVAKNKVSNYLLIGKASSKKHILIPKDMYLKSVKVKYQKNAKI